MYDPFVFFCELDVFVHSNWAVVIYLFLFSPGGALLHASTWRGVKGSSFVRGLIEQSQPPSLQAYGSITATSTYCFWFSKKCIWHDRTHNKRAGNHSWKLTVALKVTTFPPEHRFWQWCNVCDVALTPADPSSPLLRAHAHAQTRTRVQNSSVVVQR